MSETWSTPMSEQRLARMRELIMQPDERMPGSALTVWQTIAVDAIDALVVVTRERDKAVRDCAECWETYEANHG